MEQRISLREANQHLSRYIEAVQKGQEFVITRRGVPVAKLVGVPAARQLSPEQEKARARSLARMRRGYPLGGLRVMRDELHAR